jgi:hypothetical protein
MMGAVVMAVERPGGVSVPRIGWRQRALAFSQTRVSGGAMSPHTRAMIAASAFAYATGQKVAGVHDHAAGRDLRIAAEARGAHLQGYDGDRATKFGGTSPELYDGGDKTFATLEIDGLTAQGYDRGSSSHYRLTITGEIVQLYDHGPSKWFDYSIQRADQ